MGEPDPDMAIAEFMSLTGCEDMQIANSMLSQNAFCVPLAVELYESVYGKKSNNPPPSSSHNNSHGSSSSSSSSSSNHHQPGGGGGGSADNFDVRLIDTSQGQMRNLKGEVNPTNKVFETKQLQDLFKAPDYAEKVSTSAKGWRGVFDKAKQQGKYVIVNVQEQGNFWSHRLDRDVWSHSLVKDVVMYDFLLMQIWKGGDNYQDMCAAYPDLNDAELPILLLCDGGTRMELKRIDYPALMKYAGVSHTGSSSSARLKEEAGQLSNALVEILTGFIDRQKAGREPSVEGSLSSPSGMKRSTSRPGLDGSAMSGTGTGTGSGDNNNNNKSGEGDGTGGVDPDLAAALALSRELSADAAAKFPDPPDDSKDTLEGIRKEATGEGIYKLRVKFPVGSDLINWDQFLPVSTPQRALTTAVRHQLRVKYEKPLQPGQYISVSIMDRTRKLSVIFAEDPQNFTADPNSGATLADIPSLRSGEALFIEINQMEIPAGENSSSSSSSSATAMSAK